MTEQETNTVVLAEKVMVWTVGKNPQLFKSDEEPLWFHWRPYVSLADAWMLVEKLKSSAWKVSIKWPYVGESPRWHVCIQRTNDPLAKDSFHGEGATVCAAICAAALASLAGERG